MRHAVATVLGPDGVPEEPARFKPHISIAYCNDAVPAGDLVQRVGRLRQEVAPIRVNVTSVSLVELRREGHAYRLTTSGTVQLADTGRRPGVAEPAAR